MRPEKNVSRRINIGCVLICSHYSQVLRVMMSRKPQEERFDTLRSHSFAETIATAMLKLPQANSTTAQDRYALSSIVGAEKISIANFHGESQTLCVQLNPLILQVALCCREESQTTLIDASSADSRSLVLRVRHGFTRHPSRHTLSLLYLFSIVVFQSTSILDNIHSCNGSAGRHRVL